MSAHTCTVTHTHICAHSTAHQQARGECHTVAWRRANILANCQHIVGMQNSWAGAKHSGAKTRWSYPSKKDTQNMAPFPMSQETHRIPLAESDETPTILYFKNKNTETTWRLQSKSVLQWESINCCHTANFFFYQTLKRFLPKESNAALGFNKETDCEVEICEGMSVSTLQNVFISRVSHPYTLDILIDIHKHQMRIWAMQSSYRCL